jgi:Lrp/AsnC family leucine-responsive transcriptional regulator
MFDSIDHKILTILRRDARATNAEIARRVGMAPSAVLERVRKLEKKGLIQGYTTRLDPHAMGYGLLAYVFVRSDERVGDTRTAKRLAALPEVLEAHHVAGEDCYLLKVRTRDTESLGRFLRGSLGAIDTIRSTRTTIVLNTVKETFDIPLPEEADADE